MTADFFRMYSSIGYIEFGNFIFFIFLYFTLFIFKLDISSKTKTMQLNLNPFMLTVWKMSSPCHRWPNGVESIKLDQTKRRITLYCIGLVGWRWSRAYKITIIKYATNDYLFQSDSIDENFTGIKGPIYYRLSRGLLRI